jgi:hypothetical protein
MEELKDHPSIVDYGPRTVHPAECHEDPTLWKTPRSQFMCQAAIVMLPWRLLMARPLHYS